MLGRRSFVLLGLAAPGWGRAQAGSDTLVDRLRTGACAVLWRHARTVPGVGDPPGFRLDSCGTQRNLSAEGRAQARAAGEWFRGRTLKPAAVLSSAWCRCKDTADLAFGGHEVWTPLSSTFRGQGDAGAGRRAMLERLARVPAGNFEVWVTHQVNITALTQETPSMGEGLIVDSQGKVVARGIFA